MSNRRRLKGSARRAAAAAEQRAVIDVVLAGLAAFNPALFAAAEALPDEIRLDALAEWLEWLGQFGGYLQRQARGLPAEPDTFLSPADAAQHEAELRAERGDPSAPLWVACAETLRDLVAAGEVFMSEEG